MKPVFLLLVFTLSGLTTYAQLATELNVPSKKYVTDKFTAYWITNPDIPLTEYSVTHYRKTAYLDAIAKEYIVHITADNRYKLYVNGKMVCFGPQLSDIPHWRYETINIAPYLIKGKNVVAAEVVNFGPDRFFGIISHRTAFMLQGYGDNQDFNTEDRTWKTFYNQAFSPNHPNWMYSVDIVGGFYASNPGDSVKSHLYPWGWEQPQFDDSKWKTAKWVASPTSNTGGWAWVLMPRTTPLQTEQRTRFPKMARTENVKVFNEFLAGNKPILVPANTRCSILFDNQTLTMAHTEVTFSGGKSAKVKITYAENLYGKNNEKGNRSDIEGKVIKGLNDVYLLDGGVNRTFKSLWYRAFRYVQMDIETLDEPLVINDFVVQNLKAPLLKIAEFKSSNPLYDAVMDICWRTASICTQDNLVSDAYYEQMQYVGDSRVHALTLVALTGDSIYLKNAIEMFNYSRLPDGNITSCYPLRATFMHPTFSLIWVDMLHDYMMYFGNKDFMRQFLPGICATFHWFESNLNENGLPGKVKGTYFVDWYHNKATQNDVGGTAPTSKEGNSAVITLHYIYSLQNAAKIYSYLSMPYEADKCTKRANELLPLVKKIFYNQEKGLLAEDPQHTYFDQRPNIMGIITGLFDEKEYTTVIDKILKDISYISEAGYYYRFNFFNALAKAKAANYFDVVLAPWNENMLKFGLTTTPERPAKQRSEAHPWSSSPAYAYFAVLCGIKPASEGNNSVVIAPDLGTNSFISAVYPHKHGLIKMNLKKVGNNGLAGEVTMPPSLGGIFEYGTFKMDLKPGVNKVSVRN